MRVSMLLLLLGTSLGFAGMLQISVPDASDPRAGARIVTQAGIGSQAAFASSDTIKPMPGWPVQVSTSGDFGPARGVALADFDGDGRLEVIRPSTANQLHVWKYDGTYYPGWPKTLSGMGQYAASVADVDLDGEYEIAISTRGMTSGGSVYLFTENGTNKPGFPFAGLVGGNFSDAPTLADVDGDDTLEIVVGERDYPIGHMHVLRYNGQELPGAWPCSLDHVPAMGAAVGDLNRDGLVEIVYASYNSLYVFQPDGSQLAGWPQTMPGGRNFSYQSPALADIDGDDTLEIIVGMHRNGACYAWRYDGTLVTGWPYGFARWTYCPPTVADLYRNQDLKVLCGQAGIMGGAADVLFGFDNDAQVLPGFPVVQPSGDAAEGNIAVADIDGNADMEIVFSSNLMSSDDGQGFLYAVNHDGSPVSGWPLRTLGFTYMNGATIADVDGDGLLDMAVVSDDGSLMEVSVLETGVPFSRASWEWPTYQFDMARTGVYQPYVVGLGEARRIRPGARNRAWPTVLRRGASRLRIRDTEYGIQEAKQVLCLYDQTGALVHRLSGVASNGTCEFSLPHAIASGVYVGTITSPKGQSTESVRIVVMP